NRNRPPPTPKSADTATSAHTSVVKTSRCVSSLSTASKNMPATVVTLICCANASTAEPDNRESEDNEPHSPDHRRLPRPRKTRPILGRGARLHHSRPSGGTTR